MRAVQRLADGDAPDAFVVDAPVRVTVEFFSSNMADGAMRVPFAVRDGTRVSFSAADVILAYGAFRALVRLASSE
jgi:D-aminopeptidase